MIQIKLYTCPHCKDALMEGCACMMCTKCKKLFNFNGEEVKEDGSNFYMQPKNVNWSEMI